jgi:tRNA U38,U39,U40 pseudouridine synthase TruA
MEARNLFERYFRIFRAARCSRGVHAWEMVYFVDLEKAGLIGRA